MWALVGSVVGKGLSLTAGIVVARLLGKEVFGEYGMVKSTLLYLAMFSTFGLGYTSTKYVAESRRECADRVRGVTGTSISVTVVFSLVIAVALFVFAEPLARFIKAPALSGALRITAITVVLNAVNTTQTGILAGFNAFRRIAVNNTWAGVFTFAASVAMTLPWGFNGAIVALMLSIGFNCIVNGLSIRRIERGFNKVAQCGLRRELLRFSLPVAMQESLYSVTNWLTAFVLVTFAGYSELGLYSAATQWSSIILFVPGVLRNVALSHLSSNNNDHAAHRQTMRTLLTINAVSVGAMIVLVVLFSGVICRFYGESFEGLRSVLIVLSCYTLFAALSNVYVQDFMSRGRNWLLFAVSFGRDFAILAITACLLFYQSTKGAITLAATTIGVNIVYWAILTYYSVRYYDKHEKESE